MTEYFHQEVSFFGKHVFDGNIIYEVVFHAGSRVVVGGDASADFYVDFIIEELFGELIGVVGALDFLSVSAYLVVGIDTKSEIGVFEVFPGPLVEFFFDKVIECVVGIGPGIYGSGAGVGAINEEVHCLFGTFFGREGRQLGLNGLVVGSRQVKRDARLPQIVLNTDQHLEVDDT